MNQRPPASKFTRFAKQTSRLTGRPVTFIAAVLIVLIWAVTGPAFNYSQTWQLVINTGTTIITFLMVFLIQNSQNRDSEAMQIKLDEIIRALDGAHNAMLDLEELEDEELEAFRKKYLELAKKARGEIEAGRGDTGCEELDELEDKLEARVDEIEKAKKHKAKKPGA